MYYFINNKNNCPFDSQMEKLNTLNRRHSLPTLASLAAAKHIVPTALNPTTPNLDTFN